MAKKQTDGRYRSKITVGRDANGKPIYKYASGTTKKELAENAEELRRAHITGNTAARRDVLFGVYAVEWYQTYRRPKLKTVSSREGYANALNKHLLPVFADRQMRAITAEDLQRFMNSKAGMGKTSLTYMHTTIKHVFRMATQRGILDRDPALGLVKPETETEERRALTPEEEKAALKVGNEHTEGLLLLLLYYTGLRIGEAIGLQWGDIDFSKRTISVERDMDYKTGKLGAVKSEASVRVVPLPDELADALRPLRGFGAAFVLPSDKEHGPLPKSSLVKRWKRLMIAMFEADQSIEHDVIDKIKGKIKPDGEREKDTLVYGSILTAHYFRHNYASLLYNADVDILSAQRFLGHADVKTTLSIYSHLSKGKEDKSAEKVRVMFSKKKKVAEKLPK